VAYFNVLFQDLPEGTRENHKEISDGYPAHRTKFEQNTIEGSKDDVAPF
jgi:hypothetical protein